MTNNIKWSTDRPTRKESVSLDRLRDLYKMPTATMDEIQIEAERRQEEYISNNKTK